MRRSPPRSGTGPFVAQGDEDTSGGWAFPHEQSNIRAAIAVQTCLHPELVEERVLDFESHDRFEPESELFQHVDQLLAVDQLDRWCAVACGFALCLRRERTGGDDS